jgi:hypothetical protein
VKKSEMLSKYFFNCMGFLKSSKMVYWSKNLHMDWCNFD